MSLTLVLPNHSVGTLLWSRKYPKAGAKILFFLKLAKYLFKKVPKSLILKQDYLYLQPKMADLNDNSTKTEAIVLGSVPINDHTQFVHFYTEKRGRITCRIPLATRGKRASQLRLMMTPMTLLRLELKPGQKDIMQIQEAEIIRTPYLFTMEHPDKAAQCMFIAELTQHVVRPLEQEADPRLWKFLLHSLDVIENVQQGWANFHLVFTCKLTGLIGFSIDSEDYQPDYLFDLTEGVFTAGPIYHPYYLNAVSAQWLHRILLTDYEAMNSLPFTREQRNVMLDILLAFIKQQIPEIGELKSLEVLKELGATSV